jgi:hypothetical protein
VIILAREYVDQISSPFAAMMAAAAAVSRKGRRRQSNAGTDEAEGWRTDVMFVWLINHQPAVFFSQNKPATSNQPAVLLSQNKSISATSQTKRLR